MSNYIENVPNPGFSWMFSRGIGFGDSAFLRCPFCGAIREWDESEEPMPTTCAECKREVEGDAPNV